MRFKKRKFLGPTLQLDIQKYEIQIKKNPRALKSKRQVIDDKKSEDLFDVIIKNLENKGLNLSKLCGQAYDTTAGISGIYF